jgi:hypothetical protein
VNVDEPNAGAEKAVSKELVVKDENEKGDEEAVPLAVSDEAVELAPKVVLKVVALARVKAELPKGFAVKSVAPSAELPKRANGVDVVGLVAGRDTAAASVTGLVVVSVGEAVATSVEEDWAEILAVLGSR